MDSLTLTLLEGLSGTTLANDTMGLHPTPSSKERDRQVFSSADPAERRRGAVGLRPAARRRET
jgi:hypothetical protein